MSYNINLKLRSEKDFQDLVENYVRNKIVGASSRIEIFREIDVAYKVADIVTFSSFTYGGYIEVYELKMPWDKDSKRLLDQVNSYLSVADRVYVVIYDGYPCVDLPKEVNVIKVSFKDGELDWDVITNSGSYVDNKKSNIKTSRRLYTVARIKSAYTKRVYYLNNVLKVLEKRRAREDKLGEQKSLKEVLL